MKKAPLTQEFLTNLLKGLGNLALDKKTSGDEDENDEISEVVKKGAVMKEFLNLIRKMEDNQTLYNEASQESHLLPKKALAKWK